MFSFSLYGSNKNSIMNLSTTLFLKICRICLCYFLNSIYRLLVMCFLNWRYALFHYHYYMLAILSLCQMLENILLRISFLFSVIGCTMLWECWKFLLLCLFKKLLLTFVRSDTTTKHKLLIYELISVFFIPAQCKSQQFRSFWWGMQE